jgi:hypothetical protein
MCPESGAKAPVIQSAYGGAAEAAEKLEFSAAAPEGATDNATLAVCLKAYPDTNREFFRNL